MLGLTDLALGRVKSCKDATSKIFFWNDELKFDDQRTDASIIYKFGLEKWAFREVYLDKHKGVFDSELYAIDLTLDMALRAGRVPGRIT